MSDLDHAQNLLLMARKDLRAVQAMTDAEAFDDEIFGFHVQQTIEKALKAWCACVSIEYVRNHSLELLFDLLEQNGQSVSDFSELAWLTPFAVRFRYEEPDEDIPPLNRADLVQQVRGLVVHVAGVVERAGA